LLKNQVALAILEGDIYGQKTNEMDENETQDCYRRSFKGLSSD
jgi:hypothetical protein